MRNRRRTAVLGTGIIAALVAGCTSVHPGPVPATSAAKSLPTSLPTSVPTATATWVESLVTFVAGGVRSYATYRHRSGASTKGPAALLIAGSGPTDRNGNGSSAGARSLNSLRLLADQLSTEGIATLRYDKLFSGRTGAGRFALTPTTAGVDVFTAEAAAALRILAARPATDPARLGVYGHSEGGLYALLLATGHGGKVRPSDRWRWSSRRVDASSISCANRSKPPGRGRRAVVS